MAPKFKDPKDVARREADNINARRDYYIDVMLSRVRADCPWFDGETLYNGLEEFHVERMEKAPSATKYPESVPWVDYIRSVDREVARLANLSMFDMAVLRSLNDFLAFRGYGAAKPAMSEKCRIAYLPDSDHGQVHIKNVDDPAAHFKPAPRATKMIWGDAPLVQDGVGSGLHIDDEPEEIFPLNPREMLNHYADDVPGGVQFFTKYKFFWSGGNMVIRDKQKRSVAIEKCSRNFIEVFEPGPDGISHCSGMACRDPQSPQGKFQSAKRKQYMSSFNSKDAPDQPFWDACYRAEVKLSDGLKKLGKPAQLDSLINLFHTPWPEGLSKEGVKLHPNQAVGEYTLVTHATLLDQNRYIRWQRDPETLKMPITPELYQF